MNNNVTYTVTANDMLSGKLEGMNTQAQALEGTLGGLKGILSTLGVGFAVFKGLEFVHDGVEAVEKLHQAQAQVVAGLESTGYAAGVTKEALADMAGDFASRTKASRAEITELQSVMLTFPAIVKDTFPQATQTILDMSTRLKTDMSSSAIQVGKALQDPIRGITALRRVGVNFNESQTEVIRKLVETGQKAKAQQLILAELKTEFGGSAEAAFNADPLAKFNKMMGSLKMAFGEAAITLLETLMPALEKIGEGFKAFGGHIKEVVHWLEEHEKTAKFLKVVLGSIVGLLIAYNVQQKLAAMWTALTTTSMLAQTFSAAALAAGFEGASIAGMTWAGVMGIVNAIMKANPVILIITAIALMIGVVYEAVQAWDDWGAAIILILGPLGLLISAVMTVYRHWDSIKKAFTDGGIIGGLKRIGIVLLDTLLYPLQKVMEWVGKITGADWAKGAAESIKEMRKAMDLVTPEETAKKEPADKTSRKPKVFKPVTPEESTKKDKAKAVSGSKVVTINISIGNLINDFTIRTTNIQESASAVHDKIVQALTSAVNDSQVVAGES